ncbi:phage tail protein [Pandoraea fibrosis]|uniref:Phage tail protein n=1 Tax=Pandoraea fibrosis TaxID=1891094 RepID=A0A5E4SRD1_9BURK|nr:phage tail protein [Pandoraea fibrosis]VVD78386.1 hypothetical protein PFI31113_00978 [Pandoraea fibrosis]
MTATYYTIATDIGNAKEAKAIALGLRRKFVALAVGDGGGDNAPIPTPKPDQKALLGEWRRAPLNLLEQDPKNPSQLIAEQIIPENEGGKWIREMALIDEDGDICYISNAPPTYKPLLPEGSGKTQGLRMVIIVSNVATVELKIDPSVVLATREYADRSITVAMKAHSDATDPHPQYALKSVTDTHLPSEVAAKTYLSIEAAKKYLPTEDAQKTYLAITAATEQFQHIEALARAHGSQLFTQNGKMTVPDGVTDIYVSGCGGGAGGGGAAWNDHIQASGGGGGSGYWCVRQRIPVKPGQELTINIGGGGVGAVSTKPGENGVDGRNGGATTIAELGLTLGGGEAGVRAIINGVWGNGAGPGQGGNGGQWGSVGMSRKADFDNICPGGDGGSTPFGAGGATCGWSWGGVGGDGRGHGSGGSGGQSSSIGSPAPGGGGGSGAKGMLLIEW